MRHDWTLLCTEVEPQEHGTITLGNVFSTLQVYSPFGNTEQPELLLFDPPAVLVSQWTAEFDADRRVHTAIVQLLAPGGNQLLWGDEVEFDLRGKSVFHMIYLLHDLPLVSRGTFEYHVYLNSLGPIGEWGRASLTIS